MKTLNIRLGRREADAIKTLRAAGENVSEVLREALVARAAKKTTRKASKAEVLAKLDAIYDRHPGPVPEYIELGIDATNRQQMSAYIRSKILRKRGKKA